LWGSLDRNSGGSSEREVRILEDQWECVGEEVDPSRRDERPSSVTRQSSMLGGLKVPLLFDGSGYAAYWALRVLLVRRCSGINSFKCQVTFEKKKSKGKRGES